MKDKKHMMPNGMMMKDEDMPMMKGKKKKGNKGKSSKKVKMGY